MPVTEPCNVTPAAALAALMTLLPSTAAIVTIGNPPRLNVTGGLVPDVPGRTGAANAPGTILEFTFSGLTFPTA